MEAATASTQESFSGFPKLIGLAATRNGRRRPWAGLCFRIAPSSGTRAQEQSITARPADFISSMSAGETT
jgi:hypothetical protein